MLKWFFYFAITFNSRSPMLLVSPNESLYWGMLKYLLHQKRKYSQFHKSCGCFIDSFHFLPNALFVYFLISIFSLYVFVRYYSLEELDIGCILQKRIVWSCFWFLALFVILEVQLEKHRPHRRWQFGNFKNISSAQSKKI